MTSPLLLLMVGLTAALPATATVACPRGTLKTDAFGLADGGCTSLPIRLTHCAACGGRFIPHARAHPHAHSVSFTRSRALIEALSLRSNPCPCTLESLRPHRLPPNLPMYRFCFGPVGHPLPGPHATMRRAVTHTGSDWAVCEDLSAPSGDGGLFLVPGTTAAGRVTEHFSRTFESYAAVEDFPCADRR